MADGWQGHNAPSHIIIYVAYAGVSHCGYSGVSVSTGLFPPHGKCSIVTTMKRKILVGLVVVLGVLGVAVIERRTGFLTGLLARVGLGKVAGVA